MFTVELIYTTGLAVLDDLSTNPPKFRKKNKFFFGKKLHHIGMTAEKESLSLSLTAPPRGKALQMLHTVIHCMGNIQSLLSTGLQGCELFGFSQLIAWDVKVMINQKRQSQH